MKRLQGLRSVFAASIAAVSMAGCTGQDNNGSDAMESSAPRPDGFLAEYCQDYIEARRRAAPRDPYLDPDSFRAGICRIYEATL